MSDATFILVLLGATMIGTWGLAQMAGHVGETREIYFERILEGVRY